MALYRCRIIDTDGSKRTVRRESLNEITLRADFKREKRVLLKHTVMATKTANPFFMFSSHVSDGELIAFYRQFAIMLRAGGTVTEALDSLLRIAFSKYFKNVILQVYLDVQSGVLLSEAFSGHKDVFPEFFIGMTAVGEASDSLERVMEGMADYYEHERSIKRKASSAAAYPVILAVMIAFMVEAVMLFVLPRFKEFISALGGTVPPITQALISASCFLSDNIIYLAAALISFAAGLTAFSRTDGGKYAFDFIRIKIPIFGKVAVAGITARFCKAFLILLSSGMTVMSAMENLLRIFDNAVFKNRFRYSIVEVRRGKSISATIEEIKLFSSSFTELIRVGERSGDLEGALNAACRACDEDVTISSSRAVGLLEPALIVILGGVVAFVALSVVLPVLSLAGSVV